MPNPSANRPLRHGFTLLESLMAAGILLVVVLAVTSAITAGQQHSFEAQQRIAGALAAEDLLGRIAMEPYADLPDWHGFAEAPGTMTDAGGRALPATADGVGRRATVTDTLMDLGVEGVLVQGRLVSVRAFDGGDRTLAALNHFVPEPQ